MWNLRPFTRKGCRANRAEGGGRASDVGVREGASTFQHNIAPRLCACPVGICGRGRAEVGEWRAASTVCFPFASPSHDGVPILLSPFTGFGIAGAILDETGHIIFAVPLASHAAEAYSFDSSSFPCPALPEHPQQSLPRAPHYAGTEGEPIDLEAEDPEQCAQPPLPTTQDPTAAEELTLTLDGTESPDDDAAVPELPDEVAPASGDTQAAQITITPGGIVPGASAAPRFVRYFRSYNLEYVPNSRRACFAVL